MSERVGRLARVDARQPGAQPARHRPRQPHGERTCPVLGPERTIGSNIIGLRGKALQPHLAPDAKGARDRADTDPLGHGLFRRGLGAGGLTRGALFGTLFRGLARLAFLEVLALGFLFVMSLPLMSMIFIAF